MKFFWIKNSKKKKVPVVLPDTISLELGCDFVPLFKKGEGIGLLEMIQGVRRRSAHDLGFVIPSVRIIDNLYLEPSEYCFKIKGVDSGRGKISIGQDPDMDWIIATHLKMIINNHAADILGLQDTQEILDDLRKDYPAVVNEVIREDSGLRITDIWKILQGLLREQVSIRNIVSILEAVAVYAPISKDICFLTEKARQALAGQICGQYAGNDRRLRVLTIAPELEQKIIDSKWKTSYGGVCNLDTNTFELWINAVSKAVEKEGWRSVILCSEDARCLVKNSTVRKLPDLVVLSVPEIALDIISEKVGVISLEPVAEQNSPVYHHMTDQCDIYNI
jgi:flagellar biosynthesis protein FlhA